MSEWTPERIAALRKDHMAGWEAMPAALDEIERLQARVAELEAKEADYNDLHEEWSKARLAISDFVFISRDRVARDQRREQLLRAAEPAVCYAAESTPASENANRFHALAARIRAELGERA